MRRFRAVLYIAAGIPVFAILVWFFAIPDKVIQDMLADSMARAGNGSLSLSVEDFRKGILFNLHAGSVELKIDDRPALRITDFSGGLTPRYLAGGRLAFAINGKIGTGDVNGILKLPVEGKIIIDRAELDAIPYLAGFGLEIKGRVSSEITIRGGSVHVIFEVPDLNIDDSASVIPLLNTFRRLQGALSVEGNSITISSINLEGEKGYARLRGSITDGVMDMQLELMPDEDKLNTMESMLIGKYAVSPGYYVIPLRGPVP